MWDAARDRLLWVDIDQCLVLEGRLALDETAGDLISVQARHQFDDRVGAVTFDRTGDLLVAAGHRLMRVGQDGSRRDVAEVIPAAQAGRRRLNDGATDPRGRFLIGTRCYGPSTIEELVRLGHDGWIEVIDDDLTLSNGLAWSGDGTAMYSIDTLTRRIWRRAYHPSTGETGQREAFVTIDDGYPDGMCIDAEDHCWVAIYGAGEVRRFAPDGRQVGVIRLPVPQPTSVAFAGPRLEVLVITTATEDMDDDALRRAPLAGCLFTARVSVRGHPVPPWDPSA